MYFNLNIRSLLKKIINNEGKHFSIKLVKLHKLNEISDMQKDEMKEMDQP